MPVEGRELLEPGAVREGDRVNEADKTGIRQMAGEEPRELLDGALRREEAPEPPGMRRGAAERVLAAVGAGVGASAGHQVHEDALAHVVELPEIEDGEIGVGERVEILHQGTRGIPDDAYPAAHPEVPDSRRVRARLERTAEFGQRLLPLADAGEVHVQQGGDLLRGQGRVHAPHHDRRPRGFVRPGRPGAQTPGVVAVRGEGHQVRPRGAHTGAELPLARRRNEVEEPHLVAFLPQGRGERRHPVGERPGVVGGRGGEVRVDEENAHPCFPVERPRP